MQNFEIEKKKQFSWKVHWTTIESDKKIWNYLFFPFFFVLLILSLTLVTDNWRSKGNFYRQITWKRGFILYRKSFKLSFNDLYSKLKALIGIFKVFSKPRKKTIRKSFVWINVSSWIRLDCWKKVLSNFNSTIICFILHQISWCKQFQNFFKAKNTEKSNLRINIPI